MKHQCDSSLIEEFEYNDSEWIFSLRFSGTKEVRHYSGFPPELYDDFEKSASKGKFFNQFIAKKFTVQREKVAPDIEGYVPAPVEVDPQLEADIAATEARWAKQREAVVEGTLFDVPVTVVAPRLNGFDAEVEDQRPSSPKVTVAEVLPPEAELPKQNDTQITAMTEEAKLLAAKPIIVTAATYQSVYDHVADMTAKRKRLFEFLDPIRDAMYKAYNLMQSRQKMALDPLDNAIKAGKQALLAYDQEQERRRAEAQRIADEKAAADAEVERKRISEELTLAEMNDALVSGDTERAEDLFQNPIEAPPMQVYAPRVQEYQAPVVQGKSTRKNWKGEVTDLDALILDVAAGIEHFRKHKHLGGHAPSSFLVANGTAINQQAKAQESVFNVPGCRAFNDAVMNVRTK